MHRVRWLFFGLFLLICSTVWGSNLSIIQVFGGLFVVSSDSVLDPTINVAAFCTLVAVLTQGARLVGSFIYFRKEYARSAIYLNIYENESLRTACRKIIHSFVLSLVFAGIVIASFARKKFDPYGSFFDFLIIAIVVHVVVEGLLEFIKFIPLFRYYEH